MFVSKKVSYRVRNQVNLVLKATLILSVLLGWWTPVSVSHAEDLPHAVMVEDFESGLDNRVNFVQKRNYSGSMSLESNPKYVRSGQHSVRIDYDFIGVKENPSYVYVGPSTYTIPVTGHPTKIGMWVYGNNDGHSLWSQFRYPIGNNDEESFEIEYLDENVGVNWTGWKYVERELPTVLYDGDENPITPTPPINMEIYLRIEQSDFEKKNRGTIWVDDVRLIYGDLDEDTDIPSLEIISPLANDEVPTDRPTMELQAADVKSGIDVSTINLAIDSVPVQPQFDANTGKITYTPTERLAGGYHSVTASVKDNVYNPAEKNWSFTILNGAQYDLSAPNEVISNHTFELQLKVKQAMDLAGSYAKLNYDPAVLEFVKSESMLSPDRIIKNEAADGTFEFATDGLMDSDLNEDDTLATVTFKVLKSAKMERGEAYKYVSMVAGSLKSAQGETLQASAASHAYAIKFPYTLQIVGTSLQSNSVIRVTDETGAPVEGASIQFPTNLGPKSITMVTAATNIYKSADVSSKKLQKVEQGESLFSNNSTSGTFTAVYSQEGKIGWIPTADVAPLQPLTDRLGTTDANGEIRTPDLTLALTSFSLQAIKGDQISQEQYLNVVPQVGTDAPEYVQNFMPVNSKTQRNITWRTKPATGQMVIQYMKANEFTSFEQPGMKEMPADSTLLLLPKGVGESRYHNVLLSNLEPGTKYVYRVGSPENWSATYDFTTEKAGAEPFSFLFTTDSHVNSENAINIYQKLLKDAFEKNPGLSFVMHSGDIVDDGGVASQWDQYFTATSVFGPRIPSAHAIGNHDIKNGGRNMFPVIFRYPDNGFDELTYSFDYGEAHFIVLNSEANETEMVRQAAWLRKDLASSTKKWNIAMLHRPPYHTEFGRPPELDTIYLAPVLEELGVDLVLVGHDHAYANTFPMKNGKPVKNGGKGTVYLVGGSSGWKFYDAYKFDYLETLYDDNYPVYSAINVSHDAITIEGRARGTTTNEQNETIEIDKTFHQMTIQKRDVTPTPTDPTPTPSQPSPTKPTEPVVPPVKEVPGRIEVRKEQLNSAIASNNQLILKFDSYLNELILPGNTQELLANNSLAVQADNIHITIPPEVLKSLSGLVAPGQLDKSKISLKIEKLQDQDAAKLLDRASKKARAKLEVVGEILEFTLTLTTAENKTYTLSLFEKPIKISLPLNPNTDKNLLGIYFIADNGLLEYMEGTLEDGKLTSAVNHFGKYAVLKYTKTFSDLSNDHWAASVIRQLAAKRIVQGDSADAFHPEQKITRAEFTSMLVRLLRIEGSATNEFVDVAPGAWYSNTVALAAHHGIVNGVDGSRFAPNSFISRQEMVAMLVRSYSLATGKQPSEAPETNFKDLADSPEWAVSAIRKAVSLDLVTGKTSTVFDPHQSGTRAESAVLIFNLMDKIK